MVSYNFMINIIQLFYRGIPGIDWSLNTVQKTELSKLFYNTYDPSITSSITGKYLVNVVLVKIIYMELNLRIKCVKVHSSYSCVFYCNRC